MARSVSTERELPALDSLHQIKAVVVTASALELIQMDNAFVSDEYPTHVSGLKGRSLHEQPGIAWGHGGVEFLACLATIYACKQFNRPLAAGN